MPEFQLPQWPEGWVYYAGWPDLAFAIVGSILIALLIIWWRQQMPRTWFRIVTAALLAALLLCIGSYYIFVVPPYYAGCPPGCPGWRGYPLPVARISLDGHSQVAPLDFALNLLMLWLLWLGATLIWTLLGTALGWSNRSWRVRLLFILIVVVLPWAMLPRILNPPQPVIRGEDLRLAINAQRSAEFTYRITGFWVHRLALEDIRHFVPGSDQSTDLQGPISQATRIPQSGFAVETLNEVCLRGYTYFFIPWRRYRIALDSSGVTALRLTEVPVTGSCWE
jgi:hypothetical protein